MSLPLQAIDRLFGRLAATYGKQFMNMYDGIDENAVKSAWAHELAGYANTLHCVAWALEHLPERAPNAVAFKALCRAAPAAPVKQIEAAPADKARVDAELSKLGQLRARVVVNRGSNDGRAWARRIVAESNAGFRKTPTVLRFAKEALGDLSIVETV